MGTDPVRPHRLAEAEGRRLCRELYWTPTTIAPLPGEVDSNFLVASSAGEQFVLKVASPSTRRDSLELQDQVLSRLAAAEVGPFPMAVRSRRGRTLEEVEVGSSMRGVRLLTFLPGYRLVELSSRPPALLASLGRLLGRMDRTLATMREPRGRGRPEWDLSRLGEKPGLAEAIESPADRRLAEATIERYLERREALEPRLRWGVIHNDANDHNVLVSSLDPEAARLAGLIDFGDLVVSERLNEVAVAMAYVGLGQVDPWSAALPVLSGYQRECRLDAAEVELLFAAVGARLAQSVCVSARRRAGRVADEYALVSEAPAWEALRALDAMDAQVATSAARWITRGVASHA